MAKQKKPKRRELPPIVVFEDEKGRLWLADGLHRHEAYRLEGRTHIPAIVHKGSLRDAILYGCGANTKHGDMPRTVDDERLVVGKMLSDSEWSKWTDAAIAKHCHVPKSLVTEMRHHMEASGTLGKEMLGRIDD